jgi:hypothetical protein
VDDIEPAVRADDVVDHRAHRLLVRHVGRRGDAGMTSVLDALLGLGGSREIDVRGHHKGPGLRERQGAGTADSVAGTRDQGHLARQAQGVHRLPPSA